MSNTENDLDVAAIGVAIATLAAVLERNGRLSRQELAAALRQAWLEMPEDEALGDGGAFIEHMLNQLDEPLVGDVVAAGAALPPKGWSLGILKLLSARAA